MLTQAQATAILLHRQDEAIRDMEIGYGRRMPRVARNAKRRFERALQQQRALEAGCQIVVRPHGLAELLVLAGERKRSEYVTRVEREMFGVVIGNGSEQ